MKLSVYYVLAYSLLLLCYWGGTLLSVVVPPLVNDILCNDDKNSFIYGLPPDDPWWKNKNCVNYILKYVFDIYPNATGPTLVDKYIVAIVYVILLVNPDILAAGP